MVKAIVFSAVVVPPVVAADEIGDDDASTATSCRLVDTVAPPAATNLHPTATLLAASVSERSDATVRSSLRSKP